MDVGGAVSGGGCESFGDVLHAALAFTLEQQQRPAFAQGVLWWRRILSLHRQATP
jgi:hypothetical protein